jgi:MBG domain (YGX type)
MPRSKWSAIFVACFVVLLPGFLTAVSAQTTPGTPTPQLSLSANAETVAQGYQGWAMVFSATLFNPQKFVRTIGVTPLVINPQNGSWGNNIQLVVTDANGVTQNWPIQAASLPSGALLLDTTTDGRLTWIVAPSDTAALTPGTYSVVALINTMGSAGATGWNGTTSSNSVSIQITPAPSTPTAQQQENQAELLAAYDHLLGNEAQALSDLNALLAKQPDAVGALAIQGSLLDEMGQTENALAAYDQALALFYAANPGPLPEPANSLLIPQARLRSQLLSQSGLRGQPQAEIQVLDQGTQSAGVFFVDLQVTNVGNDVAENILLNQLTLQTTNGTGQVLFDSLDSPRLPVSTDFLGVNMSATVRIFFSVQGTVNAFSLTENGTITDIFGTPTSFSQNQAISVNATGKSPTPLTITPGNATQQYGQATGPNLNNVTYSGFVNGDTPASLTGALNCTTTATQSSPVGTYSITCSGLSSPNYVITYAPGTLTITAAPLMLTASNATRTYGAANPPLNGLAAGGFVNGDGLSALGGTLNCVTTATQVSSVGAYAITCAGLTSSNYTITFVPGLLTIEPAPLTISANNSSRQYGVANPPLNSVTATGFVNGDTLSSLSGALVCTTLATSASPAGAYSITCLGLSSPNYSITFLPGTLSIASDVLTVTASNATRLYGQLNPSLDNVTYAGFVNGNTPASLTGTLTCTTPAAAASSVGSYPINCSGLSSPNYAISFAPGALTITPSPLVIAANNASRPYGTNNSPLTGALNGLQNADPITASFATAAVPASPVGAYPVTPVVSDPANRLGNYNVSLVNGTLSVLPEGTILAATVSPASIAVGQPATITITLSAPDMVIPMDQAALAPFTLTSPVATDVLSNNGMCTPTPSATPGIATCSINITSIEPNGRTLNASFAGTADLSPSTATGNLIVTAALQSQPTCIRSDFRNVAVPGGSTIWFNSIFKVREVSKQLFHVSFFQSSIQFQYTDASGNLRNVNQSLPDAQITIDPSATQASTSFDSLNNLWLTTIPLDLDDNAFLTGMPWLVPAAGLPADVEPVTVCGTFASDVANIDIGWRWAAAAYSNFGPDGSTAGVKPMGTDDDNPATNHDRAGTPENFKQYVIPGARGKGKTNFTGSYTGSASIE